MGQLGGSCSKTAWNGSELRDHDIDWWKALESLALEGGHCERWQKIEEAMQKTMAFWHAHTHGLRNELRVYAEMSSLAHSLLQFFLLTRRSNVPLHSADRKAMKNSLRLKYC